MNINIPKFALNIIGALLLVFLFCTEADAQRRSNRGLNYDGDAAGVGNGGSGEFGHASWGVSLQAGFDSPQGDLGANYKGAPLIGISVLKYVGNFTFGITLSRHSYKPAINDVSVSVDMGEVASVDQSIKLTNNSFTGFYGSAIYNFNLSGGFRLFGGVNLGNMTSRYGAVVSGSQGNFSQSYVDKWGYFAPKLGIDIALNDAFSIGFEGKYNIFMQGSANSRTGGDFQSAKSVAGVATLTYSF